MSERDDEVPANPAAAHDDQAEADQLAHGAEGSPTTRLVDLAAAAIEAGNPSAIDGIAKAITMLNGGVGSPNWHQFVPKLEMPAIDFPMPKFDVSAIDFPTPKFDVVERNVAPGRWHTRSQDVERFVEAPTQAGRPGWVRSSSAGPGGLASV
jgi:hypothetical protein